MKHTVFDKSAYLIIKQVFIAWRIRYQGKESKLCSIKDNILHQVYHPSTSNKKHILQKKTFKKWHHMPNTEAMYPFKNNNLSPSSTTLFITIH